MRNHQLYYKNFTEFVIFKSKKQGVCGITLAWMTLLLPLVISTQTASATAVSKQTPQSEQQRMQSGKAITQIPRLIQGDQLLLNGQTLPVAWSQWQTNGTTRIGISDSGLMQAMGVELLNTNNPGQQPVQWFSQPNVTPFLLPTRLTPPFRYLDITNFAQQMGWQLQVNGRSLAISFPVAQIQTIRHGKPEGSDRFVFELDRPVTWRIDQQSQEFVLTVDAQADSTLLQSFKPTTGNLIQSCKLESGVNQVRLRLGLPLSLRPRVWSLPNPNRLIVDVRPDSLVERNILWAPGLRWRNQILTVGAAQFPTYWLEVNPRQSGLSLKPILPNPGTVTGIAPLLQNVRQNQAIAAINGGFFNRNTQLPLGAIRRDGRWLSGPILNRGAIGWGLGGDLQFGRLSLQETLTMQTGQQLPLTHLNSGYPQAGIARYTPDWGTTYTPITDNEILITVQNNQVTNQQTSSGTARSPGFIPADGYLLTLRASPAIAPSLLPGTSLQIGSVTVPTEFSRSPNIIGAGPLLIQSGQIVLDAKAEKFSDAFIRERASRSAIGQRPDGTVLIVAVHNQLTGQGVSLPEMAQLMQTLGVVGALNLDGGSSTSLSLGGHLIDRPPRTAARVHNGIGIFTQPQP